MVPEDGSAQHGVSALAVCRLARQAPRPAERDLVVPDYLRKPDAVAQQAVIRPRTSSTSAA